jgi:hypothetical protein
MNSRGKVTYTLGALAVGLLLTVSPGMGSPVRSGQASCLATLHDELGTVLPAGMPCQLTGECSSPADTLASPVNTWIDAGTGIMSTEHADTAAGAADRATWRDAGAGAIGQAAAQPAAGVTAAANAWIDAGTGILSVEAATPSRDMARAAALCAATSSVEANP